MSKYGNFGGSTAGKVEEVKSYKGFGYNAKRGYWMIGEKDNTETFKEIKFVPFAMRRCKEVGWRDAEDRFHATNRYPIYTNQRDMVQDQPKKQNRIQVIGVVNGELRVWGATSDTVDKLWHNPESGGFHNDLFPVGFWKPFNKYLAAETKRAGVDLSPLCFELNIIADPDTIEVGSGRKTSDSHRVLLVDGNGDGFTGDVEPFITYVGEAKASEYDELYNTEDLDAWVEEWEGAPGEVVEEEMVDPRDEKGEAPNPAMVTDETELDEVPF